MQIAKTACALLVWDKGQEIADMICTERFMNVELTGLIGRPISGFKMKHFDIDYANESEALDKSRFVTFEISFEAEVIEVLGDVEDDDEIYID